MLTASHLPFNLQRREVFHRRRRKLDKGDICVDGDGAAAACEATPEGR